jgi:tellurite resistance protein TerC
MHPAFSVSRAPFIIYSSNIFAILGLRALFGVLAHSIAGFKYLHYGMAGVLGFVGLKMVVDPWIQISPLVSVGMIAAMIGVAIWASVRRRGEAKKRRDNQ